MTDTTNNLTPNAQRAKSSVVEPRVWKNYRHPETRRFMFRYCPQTNQVEVVDKGKLAVIDLPKD